MNRRDFLKMAGLGAAGWVLSGCGIQSRREAFEEKQVGGKADGGEVTYRVLPHTQTKISTIGIGSSAIHESSGYLIMPPTGASIWSIRSCRIFPRLP